MTAKQHGLVFYPASHRYRLDGAWVQGVTTILSNATPKPGLTKWASKSVGEFVADNRETVEHLWQMGRLPMVEALKNVPWQQRDEAANRGTEVHDFAERIANGEEVDVPHELVGHVGACIEFLDDWQIKPVLVEYVVGSREHKYAGKGDLIADHRHGQTSVFDYKTSKSGIYSSTAFQNAAYVLAEFTGEKGDEHPLPTVHESYGVHIRSDGYDVMPLEFGPHVYDEFVHLLKSARILARAEGDWRTPGTGYVGLPVEHTREDVA